MISFSTASRKDITVAELGSKVHTALGTAANLMEGCAEIIASVDIVDKFNVEVEADLLFIYKYIIFNLICRCTRWYAAILASAALQLSVLAGTRL